MLRSPVIVCLLLPIGKYTSICIVRQLQLFIHSSHKDPLCMIIMHKETATHPGTCCSTLVSLFARDGSAQGRGLLLCCCHLALQLHCSFIAAAISLLSSLYLLSRLLQAT